ncbi:uncharacterized protein ACOB8E_020782 [Sarcophilus harrisii]
MPAGAVASSPGLQAASRAAPAAGAWRRAGGGGRAPRPHQVSFASNHFNFQADEMRRGTSPHDPPGLRSESSEPSVHPNSMGRQSRAGRTGSPPGKAGSSPARLLLGSKSRGRGSVSLSEVHSPAVRGSSSPPPPPPPPPVNGFPDSPKAAGAAAAAGSRPTLSALGVPAAALRQGLWLPAGLVGGGDGDARMEGLGEGEGAPRHAAPRLRRGETRGRAAHEPPTRADQTQRGETLQLPVCGAPVTGRRPAPSSSSSSSSSVSVSSRPRLSPACG